MTSYIGAGVVTAGPDKFFGTDLDKILRDQGLKTVIVVGTAAEGAVLLTATGAALRGMEVIVPVDGMSSASPYPEQYVAWDFMNAPGPLKIPQLMAEFARWLESVPITPEAAFDAHFQRTAIHPFSDGNGRTARLLTNLLLIRGGYVPITVRPEDRKQLTLAEYLSALREALA